MHAPRLSPKRSRPGSCPSSEVNQARLEREYQEKLSLYKPDWPAMQQLKAKIEQGRRHLDAVVERDGPQGPRDGAERRPRGTAPRRTSARFPKIRTGAGDVGQLRCRGVQQAAGRRRNPAIAGRQPSQTPRRDPGPDARRGRACIERPNRGAGPAADLAIPPLVQAQPPSRPSQWSSCWVSGSRSAPSTWIGACGHRSR